MCSSPKPKTVKPRKTKATPTLSASQQTRFTNVANIAADKREAIAARQREKARTANDTGANHALIKRTSPRWLQKLVYLLFYKPVL